MASRASHQQGMTLSKKLALFAVLLLAVTPPLCTYNDLHYQREAVKSAWGQVLVEYQRRADLIPELAYVVKRHAARETAVLVQVADARASLGSIHFDEANPGDRQLLARYKAAQVQMRQALSRLIAVAESYPELRTNQAFRNLQEKLEGAENRIAYARQKYIEAVLIHNLTVRTFPNNLLARVFDYASIPNFTVDSESAISSAPELSH